MIKKTVILFYFINNFLLCFEYGFFWNNLEHQNVSRTLYTYKIQIVVILYINVYSYYNSPSHKQ